MAVALLGTVVVQGLTTGASPAGAAFNNPFPADSDGFPINTIRANENLFVIGTSDIDGGRVCIVGPTSTATCDNPDWGSSNAVVGVGSVHTLIEQAPLRSGTWRLRSESKAADKWVLNTTSDTFEVFPCNGGCDTRIAHAEALKWKAGAAVHSAGAVEVCSAFAAADVVTAGQGLGKGVNKSSIKKGNEALNAYSKSGRGVAGSAVGIGVVLLGFTLPDPFGNHAKGLQLLRDVSCTVSQMYQDIVNDPPDPNYGQVEDPTFATVDPLPDTGDSDLITILDRQAKYGYAALHGYEKYLGAVVDANDPGICRQAQAVADNSYGQRGTMRDSAAELRRFATKAAADPELQGIVVSSADKPALVALYERVRASGFNATETANLQTLGFDADDIALIRESFDLDIAQLPADQTLAQILTTFADSLVTGSAAFDEFGRHAEGVAQAVCMADAPPVADYQAVTTHQDQPVPVTLTGSDPENQPITYHVVDNPTHGTLSGTAPNLTYTPPTGLVGNDSFTFTTNDGNSDSVPATVTITVLPPANQPPNADAQTITVFQGDATPVTLTGSDPENQPITYHVVDNPTHGTLSGTAPNLTYTPEPGYTGNDSFTFTTGDGTLTSTPATVTIEVVANQQPTAQDLTVPVVPGLPTSFTLAGADPDGHPITYTITGQPDHGTLSGTAPNLTYTSDESFTDSDVMTYTVSDGVLTSDLATVTFDSAPTVAVNDSMMVEGTQVIDVTVNDAPQGGRVADVTEPDHGTVTCSTYGVCLYIADEGYVGPDSFSYTLIVGSNRSTATVTATVTAKPPSTADAPVAGDDVLQIATGTVGTVDVAANDTGAGTLKVTPSDGEHGSVSCTDAGNCTYTSADSSFVGFDVFTYTLSNGTGVDTGLVRVRIGGTPGNLTVAGDPIGRGSSVTPGGNAWWQTGLGNDGPVETGPDRAGPITATATGPHTYVADSAETADGWAPSVDGQKVTVTPGPDALIGNQTTSVLPRPLPPISQGTGGDGHVPILMGTKVFAFFHHANPTQITCVDRATGQLCPGYPKTLPVSTGTAPGPAGVVGTQIWVHVQYSRTYTTTSGFFCWDTATNQTCGLVTGRHGAESWTGTPPVLIANKLWFATGAGRLRCVDPATAAACDEAPLDTDIAFTADYGNILNNGTKIYVSNLETSNCLDVGTRQRCPGWPAGGRPFRANLIRSYDATGKVDGVCGANVYGTSCVRDADPDTVESFPEPWVVDYVTSSSQEAEAGTRTFFAARDFNGLRCFDWSTMAPCTGPAFDRFGFSQTDTDGKELPSGYGAVWDGSCAVVLGDPGQLFTMDFEGNSPCTSLDSGAAPLKIDLRRQRWDNKAGAATWDQVRVFDTDLTAGTNFTSFLVTVRDADTGEVMAAQEMVDTDGTLDLSGIDAAQHPSLTIGATSRSVDGDQAWADGHAPKVQLRWNADAAPLAFRTTAAICFDGAAPPLKVTSESGVLTAEDVLPFAPPPCTATTSTSTTTTTTPSGTATTTTTTPGGTTPTTTTIPGGTATTTPGTTPTPGPQPTTTRPTGDPSDTMGADQATGGQPAPRPQPTTAPRPPAAPTEILGTNQIPTGQPAPGTAPDARPLALARTGTEPGWSLLIGGIALVVGAAFVSIDRRRRRSR